jgi:hypothetical protein
MQELLGRGIGFTMPIRGKKQFKDRDKLELARKIGLAFNVSSVTLVSPKGSFFELEAEISRKIRPAFRIAYNSVFKRIPKILREAVANSQVIRNLENPSSDLVAALGIRNSSGKAKELLDHIENSVRVVLTQENELDSRAREIITSSKGGGVRVIKPPSDGLIKTPVIVWGFSIPALGEVSSFGSYTSHPSGVEIEWATWLLNNTYKKHGHSVKFGSYPKNQSRTGRAIMARGGSFSLSRWIDPYDSNFVSDSIKGDVVVTINSMISEAIDKAIAQMPGIERDIGRYAKEREVKFDLFKGAAGAGGEGGFDFAKDVAAPAGEDAGDVDLRQHLEALKEAAAAGLITEQQVLDLDAGRINFRDLGI